MGDYGWTDVWFRIAVVRICVSCDADHRTQHTGFKLPASSIYLHLCMCDDVCRSEALVTIQFSWERWTDSIDVCRQWTNFCQTQTSPSKCILFCVTDCSCFNVHYIWLAVSEVIKLNVVCWASASRISRSDVTRKRDSPSLAECQNVVNCDCMYEQVLCIFMTTFVSFDHLSVTSCIPVWWWMYIATPSS